MAIRVPIAVVDPSRLIHPVARGLQILNPLGRARPGPAGLLAVARKRAAGSGERTARRPAIWLGQRRQTKARRPARVVIADHWIQQVAQRRACYPSGPDDKHLTGGAPTQAEPGELGRVGLAHAQPGEPRNYY